LKTQIIFLSFLFVFYFKYPVKLSAIDVEKYNLSVEINNQAILLLNKSFYFDALTKFLEAHNLNPENTEICENIIYSYYQIVNHYIKNQNYKSALLYADQALTFIDKAQNINKQYQAAPIYFAAASAYFSLKQYDDAIALFELSKADTEFNAPADYNISAAYINLTNTTDDTNLKIKYLMKALNYNKQDAEIYFQLAQLYFFEKDFDAAQKFLDKTIYYNNDLSAEALFYQGLIAEETGDIESAINFYKQAQNQKFRSKKNAEICDNNLKLLLPAKYKLFLTYKIINNSNVNLENLSLKIPFIKSISNRQIVLNFKENINANYKKKEFSEQNNNYLEFSNIDLPANNRLICKLEYDIQTLPIKWDLSFLKNKDISNFKITTLPNNIDKKSINDAYSLLRAIYDFTMKSIDYQPPISEDADIETIISTGRGRCAQYTKLFLYFLKSVGFKARKVSGEIFKYETDIINSSTNESHSWVEIFFDNIGWVAFDPTFEDTSNKNFFGFFRNQHIIILFDDNQDIKIDYNYQQKKFDKPEKSPMILIETERKIIKQ